MEEGTRVTAQDGKVGFFFFEMRKSLFHCMEQVEVPVLVKPFPISQERRDIGDILLAQERYVHIDIGCKVG